MPIALAKILWIMGFQSQDTPGHMLMIYVNEPPLGVSLSVCILKVQILHKIQVLLLAVLFVIAFTQVKWHMGGFSSTQLALIKY